MPKTRHVTTKFLYHNEKKMQWKDFERGFKFLKNDENTMKCMREIKLYTIFVKSLSIVVK